jgi:hypothetical protein
MIIKYFSNTMTVEHNFDLVGVKDDPEDGMFIYPSLNFVNAFEGKDTYVFSKTGRDRKTIPFMIVCAKLYRDGLLETMSDDSFILDNIQEMLDKGIKIGDALMKVSFSFSNDHILLPLPEAHTDTLVEMLGLIEKAGNDIHNMHLFELSVEGP